MSPQTVLVGGGVRCGKSAFALRLAQELGSRRVFIATAQAFDAEMAERIAAHQLERAALFDTLEEPSALPETLEIAATRADVVVIDCLTLWLSNLILQDLGAEAVAQRVEALAGVLAARRCHVIMVTNEVGMGLVPETALGRLFRDCAGRAHQRLARECDQVYAGVLGCIMRLRPAPVELVS
ncbi:MAG TPA: bifunctional adenosylcobinamide kinase/adenosylcobinamide-phosphate guanylyltransferase [Polyangiales bacterium]|jgi:adenosylcobinamide kinase/adenosylcobinamide-phosphate guanylyltransferase|nr:bifunctional adenosylcobinamide kinase/adenosylcobinamide-phosphate guanylyltransferase [Polyangiales bacterium]